MANPTKTSDTGRAMLEQREGVRLKAYQDTKGIWTIGVGHTSAAGPPQVTPDLTITQAQCDQIFAGDLGKFETTVTDAIDDGISVSDNEFDAMVSLCFNIGQQGFANSTVVKRLNAGDKQGAANAFLMWDKPPEIMGRRKSEQKQFLTPYAPEA